MGKTITFAKSCGETRATFQTAKRNVERVDPPYFKESLLGLAWQVRYHACCVEMKYDFAMLISRNNGWSPPAVAD